MPFACARTALFSTTSVSGPDAKSAEEPSSVSWGCRDAGRLLSSSLRLSLEQCNVYPGELKHAIRF